MKDIAQEMLAKGFYGRQMNSNESASQQIASDEGSNYDPQSKSQSRKTSPTKKGKTNVIRSS